MATDRTDKEILVALQRDGRASYADIGKAVGLSAPAVKRRVDRMRDDGVIRGFTAVVDSA
ncbi:Lrp/AsnC family transcriptional regulator, partial [Motilibacter deserti]